MSDERDILWEARTPLGFTVRVTRGYWRIITTIKHPVMAGREAEARAALETPEQIRRSKSDPTVYFFTVAAVPGGGFARSASRPGAAGFSSPRT